MKRTKSWLILLVGLLLVFMIAGFGSLADNNRDESRKSSGGASGIQQTYLFASPTLGKQSDNEVGEIGNRQAGQDKPGEEDGNDPDMPPGMRGSIDKETYLRMRDEYIALRRGIEPGRPFDPGARGRAIDRM